MSTFSDLFAYEIALVGLSAEGRAEEIVASCVTGNYFSALGLQPAVGRLFLPGEGEKPGEAGMIVLGYSYWEKRFGGGPRAVGKQVLVDGKPVTIVGVAPKEFGGLHPILEMHGYLTLNRGFGFGQGANGYGYTRGVRLASTPFPSHAWPLVRLDTETPPTAGERGRGPQLRMANCPRVQGGVASNCQQEAEGYGEEPHPRHQPIQHGCQNAREMLVGAMCKIHQAAAEGVIHKGEQNLNQRENEDRTTRRTHTSPRTEGSLTVSASTPITPGTRWS